MVGSGLNFVFILLIFCGQNQLLESQYCDEGKASSLEEGIIGETGIFPWLGVLRVHLHQGNTLKIALTGLVLIKDKFAIANADDVVRIPRGVFKEDSKAMFIPKNGEPWYRRLEDYLTHPEYEYATVNTIAIVELSLEDGIPVPFLPVCWPSYSFNTSHYIYSIGYTDKNKLLEKEIYKLQYIKQKNCEEFYVRAGLSDGRLKPAHYQCAFATHALEDCVWENGLVVASNSSGSWTIIGLGIRGPGCAAPARFIDMVAYMPWLQSATDLEQISDYRKSAFGIGFRKTAPKQYSIDNIQEVPIHYTFFPTTQESTENSTTVAYSKDIFTHPYHINIDNQQYFVVDRVDKDAININIFDEKYEASPRACDVHKTLIYSDRTRIVANGSSGTVSYRVTLYDMYLMGYTCIKLRIKSRSRSKALVWWMTYIDQHEATSFTEMGETPRNLLKNIPNKPRIIPPEHSKQWPPGPHLEPQFLTDNSDYSGISNVNLLIKFVFSKEAVLHVYVYGPPYPQHGYTTVTPINTEEIVTISDDKSVSEVHNDSNDPTNLTVNLGSKDSAIVSEIKNSNKDTTAPISNQTGTDESSTVSEAKNRKKNSVHQNKGASSASSAIHLSNYKHSESSWDIEQNTEKLNKIVFAHTDFKGTGGYKGQDRLLKAETRKAERRKMERSRTSVGSNGWFPLNQEYY